MITILKQTNWKKKKNNHLLSTGATTVNFIETQYNVQGGQTIIEGNQNIDYPGQPQPCASGKTNLKPKGGLSTGAI